MMINVEKLTEREHEIYDRLLSKFNKYGKNDVDYIFARLIGAREAAKQCRKALA